MVTSANVTAGFGSHASETVGAAKLGWAGHSIVALFAHVIVGAVVSRTVIVCAHVLLLPQWSVAVHVRVTL